MKIYRQISVMLAAALLLTGCAKGKGSGSLYDEGLDCVKLISSLANSDEYTDALSNDSAIHEYIDGFAKQDCSSPDDVYEINIDTEEFLDWFDIDADDLSKDVKSYIENKCCSGVVSRINGKAGTKEMAAGAALNITTAFVDKSCKKSSIYLYVYDGGYPVMVAFTPEKDGAVMAAGCVIFNDDFECGSADDIEDELDDFDAKVRRVSD